MNPQTPIRPIVPIEKNTLSARGQTALKKPFIISSVETLIQPRVTDVDRIHDGVLITFDDGKCAAYPAALLLSIFSQAIEVDPFPDDIP